MKLLYSAIMLVIRKEQLEALQRVSDRRWYGERLAELYSTFAEASLPLRENWLQGGLQRGAGFGIERESMLQFLAFEQTFHPGCLDEDAFEWARLILNNDAESPAERVKQLRHAAVRHLLEQEALEEQQQAEAADADAYLAEDAPAETTLT